MSDIVERLNAEVLRLQGLSETIQDEWGKERIRNAALTAEVERLRAALRWYANENVWRLADRWADATDADVDGGNRARAALTSAPSPQKEVDNAE